MVAEVQRTVHVKPNCPVGESACSDGVTCSTDGFCGTWSGEFRLASFVTSLFWTEDPSLRTLTEVPKPSIQLAGEFIISIQQVQYLTIYLAPADACDLLL